MNDEEHYHGCVLEAVPKKDPTGKDCMGRKKLKRDGEVVRDDDGNALFDGYCRSWPGKGTDHVGEGRCKFHGGSSSGAPSGEENGNFKHGLYSSVIREEDHDTLQRIEDMTTAAKLESTLNVQVLKLHRAVEGMESEDRASFLDVFEEVVAGASAPDGEIDANQLRSLAKMLGENDRAIREWADLIRRTAKDLHKITDGEEVRVEHGVDEDSVSELRDILGDGF